MKNIVLFAYSSDTTLMEWLQFLVEKEDAKIFICPDEAKLEELLNKTIPDILLIDDEVEIDNTNTSLKLIDKLVPRKRRGACMVVVLSSNVSNLEYKLDFLIKGADYIVEKPINMLELTVRISAMVRHQRYVQEHINDYVTQTRDITTFDTMDRIMTYLTEHIRPIVQEHISKSSELLHDHKNIDKDFINTLKNDSIEILASLNAIRDEVHGLLLQKRINEDSTFDHLENLFKKNLDLIHIAYDGFHKSKAHKENNK